MDNLPDEKRLEAVWEWALWDVWRDAQKCDADHRQADDPRSSTHCHTEDEGE